MLSYPKSEMRAEQERHLSTRLDAEKNSQVCYVLHMVIRKILITSPVNGRRGAKGLQATECLLNLAAATNCCRRGNFSDERQDKFEENTTCISNRKSRDSLRNSTL